MKFTVVVDEIPLERELIFTILRDRLPEMVAYMPNVERIDVQKLEREGEVVHKTNLWTGSADEVPTLVRPMVSERLLQWVDKATWDITKWRVDWDQDFAIFPGGLTARGSNVYEDDGGETNITISGEFTIHPDRLGGIPSSVARRAAPYVERFVIGQLKPNFRQTIDAVIRFAEDHY